MIHFFHGQFDHPTMWNNYNQFDTKIKIYNLYEMSDEELDLVITRPDDIIVGYSLGGRIALKIASNNHFNLKRLILLSTHPGLFPHEIEERKIWEEEILNRMRTNSLENFFKFWNSLPLFIDSRNYLPIDQTLFKKSILLFERNRLSNQPDYMGRILEHKSKILYLYGSLDKKYSALASLLSENGVETFALETDHRVHLHKKIIMEIIKRELLT